MRAIADAYDDDAVSADVRAATLSELAGQSVEELQTMADMHILFADDAPADLMLAFWLRKRMARELLKARGIGDDSASSTPC